MCGRARTRVCVCVHCVCAWRLCISVPPENKSGKGMGGGSACRWCEKGGEEGVDGIWVRAVKVGHHEVVTRAWLHITGGIFLKTSTTAK